MKFPAVTFLLLSVSAPLPSIASHQTVTRHPAPGQCMYLYPVLVPTLSRVASGPECRPAGPRVIMFQGTILIVTRD